MKSALTFRTTMVIRSPGTLLPRSERTLAPSPVLVHSRPHSDGPRVLRDPSFSSLDHVPPPAAPRFLPEPFVGRTVSPRAPITRRNAHLVHDGGPITVSNHSKLLSTHGFSPESRGSTPLPSPPSPPRPLSPSYTPEFLIRLRRLPISRRALSTGDCRLARPCRRLAFLITVMVHRQWSGNTNRAMEIAPLTSGKSLSTALLLRAPFALSRSSFPASCLSLGSWSGCSRIRPVLHTRFRDVSSA